MRSILSFLDRLFNRQTDKSETVVESHLTPEEVGRIWLKNNKKASQIQGQVVIACPNEWQNMVIGCVEGELTNGILIIRDFVTDSQLVVFSPWVKFSVEELKHLCSLNPYQRYNKVAKSSSVDMCKPKSGIDSMTFEDYMSCVLKQSPDIFNNK